MSLKVRFSAFAVGCAFAAALVVSILAKPAGATTYTWTGTGSGLTYDSAANWVSTPTFDPTDTYLFSQSGSASINVDTGEQFGTLEFAGGVGPTTFNLNVPVGGSFGWGGPNGNGNFYVTLDSGVANNITFTGGSGTYYGFGAQVNFASPGPNLHFTNNSTSGGQLILDTEVYPYGGTSNLIFGGAGNITETANGQFVDGGGGVYNGDVMSLVANGPGTLTLYGTNNQYHGSTTVNGGTLTTYGALTNTSSLAVASGAAFDAEAANATGVSAPWNVNGMVYSGSGVAQTLGNLTLGGGTLSGNATGLAGSGNFTIKGASYSIASSGNSLIGAPAGLSLQGNTALGVNVVNPGDVLTISSPIFDVAGATAGIAMSGSGTLILSGNNTYAGGTTIGGGTLQLGGSGVLGGGNYSAGISIGNSGALVMSTSSNQTFSGAISGGGALTQAGPGILTLTAGNSMSGSTIVSGGTLTANANGALGSSNVLVTSGATLLLNGNTDVLGNYVPLVTIQGGLVTTTANGNYNQTTQSVVFNGGGTLSSGAGGVNDGYGNYNQNGNVSVINPGATTAIISAGTLNLYISPTFTVARGTSPSDLTVSSDVSGSGLTLTGGGIMTLTGNNTYAGATTINAGTLQIGGGGVLGGGNYSAAISISSSGALVMNSSSNQTFAGAISGAGPLTQAGPGVLTLAGNNTYAGGTTISGGTLQLGGSGVLGGGNYSAGISIGNSGALVMSTSSNQTFSGAISGGGALTQAGPGILTLTAGNSMSGSTTVSGGILAATANGALGTSNVLVTSGGTLLLNGNIDVLGNYVPLVTIQGGLVTTTANGVYHQTTQSVVFNGGGTLSSGAGGVNDGYGNYNQNGNVSVINPGATTAIISAGTLNLYISPTFTVARGTSPSDLTVSSDVSGNGITLTGGGIMTLTGNNTYAGGTTINAGTLQIGGGGVLGGGNYSAAISISSGGALVMNSSSNQTFAGAISGAGPLTQAGPGVLTLAANNTYGGLTTVSGGVLSVTGTLNNSGGVSVNSGVLSGNGSITGPGYVYVFSGGTLAPGNIAGAGTLNVTNLVLGNQSVLNYTLGASAGGNAFVNCQTLAFLPPVLSPANVTLNILDSSLSTGTYALFSYTAGVTGLTSTTFAIGTAPASVAGDNFTFNDTGSVLDLIISPSGSQTINGTWATNGSGTWSTSGNWSGGVPGSGQDTAVFGTALTSGTATVTLDGSRSLASLGFSTTGGNSYVIAASGASTLTLANTLTSTAALSNSGGNHTINAPIVLGSNLSVTATTGSALTIAGGISESSTGTSVSVSGGGEVILSGTDTYTGGTNVSAATLAITSASALSSTGVVTLSGGGQLVLGSGSGIGALLGASAPIGSGAIALSAAASVPATLAPIGNSFENMATLGGAPSLSQGGGGSAVGVTAAAVPEPGTLALLAVAVGGLLACARRRRQSR